MKLLCIAKNCLMAVCVLAIALTYSPCSLYGQSEDILLGIEPEHNIFEQMERYRHLAAYLSEKLGVKVNLTIMSRYGEVIKRFKEKKLDGAFLSSYTAYLGIRELDLEPVVNPVNLGGESTSRGYIFVRKDSGIRNVENMKDKRIVFVDPATTEGYLFPLAYLHQQGVTDLNAFFNNQFSFSGSHASAVYTVLDGRADIGAVKNTVFQKVIYNDPSIKNELSIIAESDQIPEITLCLKKGLEENFRKHLKNALLRMDKSKEGQKVLNQFEALRFVEADRSDFVRIDKLAQKAWAIIMVHGE